MFNSNENNKLRLRTGDKKPFKHRVNKKIFHLFVFVLTINKAQ